MSSIAEVNLQVESLAEELHQKVEENTHLKEEITILLGQVADLQTKIRKVGVALFAFWWLADFSDVVVGGKGVADDNDGIVDCGDDVVADVAVIYIFFY